MGKDNKYTPEEYWHKHTEYLNRFTDIANSMEFEELHKLWIKYKLVGIGARRIEQPGSFNTRNTLASFPSAFHELESYEQYELKARKWLNEYLADVKRFYSKIKFNLDDYQREADGRIRHDFESWDKYLKAYEMRVNGSTFQNIGDALRERKKDNIIDETNSQISAGKNYVEKAELLIAKAGLGPSHFLGLM